MSHIYTEHFFEHLSVQRALSLAGFEQVARRERDPALDHRNAERSLFVRATRP